ncbi:hypothetical protein [Bacillus sp. MUM 13]|nr:hypothetical protein [Bacillus sp. MUM 13]
MMNEKNEVRFTEFINAEGFELTTYLTHLFNQSQNYAPGELDNELLNN